MRRPPTRPPRRPPNSTPAKKTAKAKTPRRAPDRFARAVRVYIDQVGMSVVELSGRSGVDRSSLSAWLNGRRALKVGRLIEVLDAIDKMKAIEVIIQPPRPIPPPIRRL